MYNMDVRNEMKRWGIHGYEAAAAIGISETSFSRMLCRSEIAPDRKSDIMKAMQKIVQGRGKD